MLFRDRTWLSPAAYDHAQGSAVTKQRHSKQSSNRNCRRVRWIIVRVGFDILNMQRRPSSEEVPGRSETPQGH
jgi:hypothetical protein